MSHKSRLQRLETKLGETRCPQCTTWDAELATARLDADGDLASVPPAAAVYCEGCGRPIQVVQLVEVVVHNRTQALRWTELAEAG